MKRSLVNQSPETSILTAGMTVKEGAGTSVQVNEITATLNCLSNHFFLLDFQLLVKVYSIIV